MDASKSGRRKTRQTSCVKPNPASAATKVWGESYYLDLENEDKKQYMERSTLSNSELFQD